MKKIFLSFCFILGLLMFSNSKAEAFYIEPPSDYYTYQGYGLESVNMPYVSSEIYQDGYNVEQDWKLLSSSPSTERYFRVLSLKKEVCIPMQNLTEIYIHMRAGDTFTFEVSKNISYTTTHETSFTTTVGTKLVQEISGKISGLDFVEIGGSISEEYYAEISTTIKNSTSLSATVSYASSVNYEAEHDGYYRYEYRTHFKMYVIQEATLCYDMVGNRRTDLPPKAYVEYPANNETFLRCTGGDFASLIRYNKVGSKYEICSEDFNDDSCYYW